MSKEDFEDLGIEQITGGPPRRKLVGAKRFAFEPPEPFGEHMELDQRADVVSDKVADEMLDEARRLVAGDVDATAGIRTLALVLRDRRADVEKARGAVDAARKALDATPEAARLSAAQAELAQQMTWCSEAEAGLREVALDRYRATGERKFPGVQVKVGRKVVYSYEEAEAWVKTNMPALLILDKPAFEKYVLGAKTPPKCVKVEDDPKTAIASNLEGL